MLTWVRELLRRGSEGEQLAVFKDDDGRRWSKLASGDVVWTRVLGVAEGESAPQIVYNWPTDRSASWLLKNCTPTRGGDDSRVLGYINATVFPEADAQPLRGSSGPRRMSAEDFLADAERLERSASTIRFTASPPPARGPFVVIWTAPNAAEGSPAEVQAIFTDVPNEMTEMVSESIIDKGKHVAEQLVNEGKEIQELYVARSAALKPV